MHRKPGRHTEVSRRGFLTGLALSAGAAIVPGALGQPAAPASADTFSIAGAEVEFWLTPLNESTLRISVLAKGSGLEPATAFPGFGLRDRVWPAPAAGLNRASPSTTWNRRKISVTSDPLTLIVLDTQRREIQRLTFDAATGKINFQLHDLPVFGMGEGGHQFDRRGVIDAMRNGQFKPDQFLERRSLADPVAHQPGRLGALLPSPHGTFDLTGKEGVFRPSEPAQPHDFFLIVNPDPSAMLREYAQLTGMPHLPPLWAWATSNRTARWPAAEAVLEETKTFRSKKLPCDVMIYLGTGFAPSGWNTGHGSFAFNQKIFPDPETMFHQMHDEDFRVVLHVLGAPTICMAG